MRFEKLSENKIRIIIDTKDLEKNNIDFHSFMSNPIESQTLFFHILDKIEKEIGFRIKNYNIKLEVIQIANSNFILTITKSIPENINTMNNNLNRKLTVKRKTASLNTSTIIYCFNSFDDFCSFSTSLISNNILTNTIAKNISLYEYKNQYYLVFSNINLNCVHLKSVFPSISEFATYISNSDLFKSKLLESGNLIIKNNALEISIKYFS